MMTPADRFQAVILTGGRGSRPREVTGRLPKSMLRLRGRPLLEHQLDLCRRHGFLRVLLLVDGERGVIGEHFGDGSRHGVTLAYQIEPTPRGTGGALRDALPHLADTFLAIYGDTYLDVDLRRFWNVHIAMRADITMFVHPNDHPQDSDLVEMDDRDVVTAIRPCPHPEATDVRNLVNANLYVMQHRGLDAAIAKEGRVELEKHTLPLMLEQGARIYGYRSPEYVRDAGTPEQLDRVQTDVETGLAERLSGRAPRRAVFLDRDGTLNTEVEHLKRPEELVLLDEAAEAVRRLNRAGYLAIIVTNQSVVARGDVTLAELERIHARLERLLDLGHAYVDRIYACPHHPDPGFPGAVPEFTVVCECRKPATGSIDAARRELGIDLGESWFVGDTTSDIETGRRAHLRTILVRTGHAGRDGRFPLEPDYVVADLMAAVNWILEGHSTLLSRMAPVATATAGARLVVIGGPEGSGTSEAAQVLREAVSAIGRTAHVIALDSWRKPETTRAEAVDPTAGYDVEGMLATVSQLVGRRDRITIELPVYDRARSVVYAHRRLLLIDAEDLLVVEGVSALLVGRLGQMADVRVHVYTPETGHATSFLAGDREPDRSDTSADSPLTPRPVEEIATVEKAKTRADFVVAAWVPA